MRVHFRAMEELDPGPKWLTHFDRLLPAYRSWFSREGDAARPSYLKCVRALRRYMPELIETYESLVEMAGGGDLVARLLSLYRPTPYLTGCSQAVWTRDEPMLVRNYDYSPRLWDATLWHTRWNGMRVIAMSDCFWGVLDGINEAGLSVSLAFGGRKVVGDGFGIPIVLRYILEFCEETDQAVKVLQAVPSHMSYNITLLDAKGTHATVFVSPDRAAALTKRLVATNHQREVEWRQFAHATASVDRERYLRLRLGDENESAARFLERFQQPPIFSTAFMQGWGTLYTAVYRSSTRRAEYRWAQHSMSQSFSRFIESEFAVAYPTG